MCCAVARALIAGAASAVVPMPTVLPAAAEGVPARLARFRRSTPMGAPRGFRQPMAPARLAGPRSLETGTVEQRVEAAGAGNSAVAPARHYQIREAGLEVRVQAVPQREQAVVGAQRVEVEMEVEAVQVVDCLAVQEQAVQEQAVQEQAVQEQAVQEQAVQEQAVQEQVVQEQAVQEQVVQEQVVPERAAPERVPRGLAARGRRGRGEPHG